MATKEAKKHNTHTHQHCDFSTDVTVDGPERHLRCNMAAALDFFFFRQIIWN